MASRDVDGAISHFPRKLEQQERQDCYWNFQELSGYAAGQQEQQDTQLDDQEQQELHNRTTGYSAGQQDTQPDNSIHGWITGYTAGQQDTQPDNRDNTPQQAGTGARPKGAEPEPRHYSGLLLQLQQEQNSTTAKSVHKRPERDWCESNISGRVLRALWNASFDCLDDDMWSTKCTT